MVNVLGPRGLSPIALVPSIARREGDRPQLHRSRRFEGVGRVTFELSPRWIDPRAATSVRATLVPLSAGQRYSQSMVPLSRVNGDHDE